MKKRGNQKQEASRAARLLGHLTDLEA